MLSNPRYYSLDVFRGITVALMILVNNPGTWAYMYAPLKHAPWHGCTPTDLVFPFFLFAVGNAMAFVMPKLQAAGQSTFSSKLLKRTLLIFLIGVFLNWAPFVKWENGALVPKLWENLRIMGVLQRIALCYFIASIFIYFAGYRKTILWTMVLLSGYWLLTYLLKQGPDPYSLEGFWGTALDRNLLTPAHMYTGEGVAFDPEGLAGSISGAAQVMIGYLTGYTIIKNGKTAALLSKLALIGAICVILGMVWDIAFPMNKKIWSSSYVLFTSGLAISILNILIWLIEFRGIKGGITRFFDVFGKNPLFIFVLSGFLPRLLALIRIPNGVNDMDQKIFTTPFGWFYQYLCKPLFRQPEASSFFYSIIILVFYWFICWKMDKNKIYVKV